jgi:hypothetical protein
LGPSSISLLFLPVQPGLLSLVDRIFLWLTGLYSSFDFLSFSSLIPCFYSLHPKLIWLAALTMYSSLTAPPFDPYSSILLFHSSFFIFFLLLPASSLFFFFVLHSRGQRRWREMSSEQLQEARCGAAIDGAATAATVISRLEAAELHGGSGLDTAPDWCRCGDQQGQRRGAAAAAREEGSGGAASGHSGRAAMALGVRGT